MSNLLNETAASGEPYSLPQAKERSSGASGAKLGVSKSPSGPILQRWGTWAGRGDRRLSGSCRFQWCPQQASSVLGSAVTLCIPTVLARAALKWFEALPCPLQSKVIEISDNVADTCHGKFQVNRVYKCCTSFFFKLVKKFCPVV